MYSARQVIGRSCSSAPTDAIAVELQLVHTRKHRSRHRFSSINFICNLLQQATTRALQPLPFHFKSLKLLESVRPLDSSKLLKLATRTRLFLACKSHFFIFVFNRQQLARDSSATRARLVSHTSFVHFNREPPNELVDRDAAATLDAERQFLTLQTCMLTRRWTRIEINDETVALKICGYCMSQKIDNGRFVVWCSFCKISSLHRLHVCEWLAAEGGNRIRQVFIQVRVAAHALNMSSTHFRDAPLFEASRTRSLSGVSHTSHAVGATHSLAYHTNTSLSGGLPSLTLNHHSDVTNTRDSKKNISVDKSALVKHTSSTDLESDVEFASTPSLDAAECSLPSVYQRYSSLSDALVGTQPHLVAE